MEERRIALPFVKPASLIISTISKPDFFNGSLANNFVAESLAPLFLLAKTKVVIYGKLKEHEKNPPINCLA
jgi:hypothetical protein